MSGAFKKIIQKSTEFLRHNPRRALKISNLLMLQRIPPKLGYIKLNTDGLSKSNPRMGAEGVFRDSHGNWICGFQVSLPHTTNLLAELIALRTGLRIAVHI